MLCYDVSNCDCCGRNCINHDDKETHIIKKYNLSRKAHKHWKGCCRNMCSGEQLYYPQKPFQIIFYKLHHESKGQLEFVKLKKKTRNASMCDFRKYW